jgi:hypothetical protein
MVTVSDGTFTDTQDVTVTVIGASSIIFEDDFQRLDSAIVANNWVEIESNSLVKITNGRVVFDANDDQFTPLIRHLFTSQTSGTISWSFNLNFQRSGNEGTYSFWMQLGQGSLMNDTAPAEQGVAVNIKWGGPNTGLTNHEGLGYVVDGTVTEIATVSGGNTMVTVTVDLDSNVYSISVGGQQTANISFENNVSIDTVRFFTDVLNMSNFAYREIDNVSIVSQASSPAPVLNPIADITVIEGDTVTLSPTATDPDGDTLTFNYSGWMTSNSYTTNYIDVGTHTVTVTVSDGILTDSQDVAITVVGVNAPVLDPIENITVNEGDTITLNPTATDPNGYILTYSYTGWMTSNTYITGSSDVGTHTVTVTVSNGMLTDSQDVTITVINTDVSQVTISWNANTETDLAGYKVYYGNSSGNYNYVVDVGNQTSYILSNLVSGETYYIAVTAYDTSGNESTYANEVIYNVPVF